MPRDFTTTYNCILIVGWGDKFAQSATLMIFPKLNKIDEKEEKHCEKDFFEHLKAFLKVSLSTLCMISPKPTVKYLAQRKKKEKIFKSKNYLINYS